MIFLSLPRALTICLTLGICLGTKIGRTESPLRWSDSPTPTAGPARSLGATNLGCLVGGEALIAGTGPFEILRPQRNRFWGHPLLIATLRDLARNLKARGQAPLLVADMGLPRGGPMPDGHRSHMTGLDADIWFKGDRPAPHDPAWLASPTALSAVTTDGQSVDPAVFDVKTRILLDIAAHDPRVDRIFVNPAIKRALCQERGEDPDAAVWLGKLRPWWGHDRHAHLRLSCPDTSPDCLPQPPIPQGTGCDATLDWWFTEEARTPKSPAGSPPPHWPPPPPPICAQLATD
ncbi:penicillin-insensitive murein endopeptidase [Rhodospirillum sp. A1_3_36]|uniref:penicillin-insensitive murein endopeptidase n=1 Tax=Rhodospirillum sp. A1_3_36 TaxID=3391666 RepID=UPI0039A5C2EA